MSSTSESERDSDDGLEILSCTCLMTETVGMPCSHLFDVMKMENLEAIPKCMILLRWTKQAKLGMRPEMHGTWTHQYMTVEHA